MVSYDIQWKKSAEKDLFNIDHQQIPRIIKNIESLVKNPFPKQYCKLRGTVYGIGYRVYSEEKNKIQDAIASPTFSRQ